MPEMFDRMMADAARDPAGGFAGVLKDHEAAAMRATTLSAREERQIGLRQREEFLNSMKANGFPIARDARSQAYLEALVNRLAGRMKNRARYPKIDVFLITSPVPDGQAIAGGSVVFTTALLDEPDEATVAGVVAHELAHLDRGHVFEYAKREKLAQTAFSGGMPDPSAMMTRGMALGSLMMDPYRPEHEHEADCTAATWLYQDGYSPHGLADFFNRMHRRNRDRPDTAFWKVARWHPYSLDRREAVLERLTQLQRWKPRDDLKLYPDNLARRSARSD